MKRLVTVLTALALGVAALAQSYDGGVSGTVIDRTGKTPVEGASVQVLSGAAQVSSFVTGADGKFLIEDLRDGDYVLVVDQAEYLEARIGFNVSKGAVRNLFNISLSPSRVLNSDANEEAAEFDLDDSGYSDNPTILFGANDVFTNMMSFNSVRFRMRGYSNESQGVYVAGVKLNDAITGYAPYSLWSGINEGVRTKVTSIGLDASPYGFGGYNGLTNIAANAGSVRTGLRGSVLTNSALYRFRAAMSYSRKLDNGWTYAINLSARLGDNDWVEGVYYKTFAYYLAAEKNWGDVHKLGFTVFAAPGRRGAQIASTQEVYDLVGSNFYNANWGYQNGKLRNARMRTTHEPVAIVKYDYTPSEKFNAALTALYRFGKNGYTALDYYDAPSPNPDYYRNLPSYYWSDNEDLGRNSLQKYYWAKEAWESGYAPTVHMNWDRFYEVNRLNRNSNGQSRSKYIQEERHTDQQDFHLAASLKWRPADWALVSAGVNGRVNRTEYYKIAADLLGGDYFVNIDNFAERDWASSQAKIQNDLDYFLESGASPIIHTGDKYGYDYYAHARNAEAWANGEFNWGRFGVNLSGRVGYEDFWREGLLRKGLFAGLDNNGNEIVVDGVNLTTYDDNGEVITSYGDSKKSHFLTWGVKGGLNYVIGSSMRIYGNVGLMRDAPKFNQAFISPRTRNTLIPDLDLIKTFSSDVNFQYVGSGYNFRLTGYFTKIDDQTDMMSYYDDIQNAFSNFSMSNIDQLHAGVELGFKAPLPVPNLSLQGAFNYGYYIYTSTPFMTQTVDNSAETIIDHQQVPYWMSHPVFRRDKAGNYKRANIVDHFERHYVPSTPQTAASLSLNWNKNYWFLELGADWYDRAYLDMNPLYRTDMAASGVDGVETPAEIEYMSAQEKFDPAFFLNFSLGKSWYIHYKYQLGFSLNARNLLNNTSVKTGGYEQTRLVKNTERDERYYRFDSKYFYAYGFNYMLNVYFRF